MAGEIDNLEIRISASADGASKNISKLADSLSELGQVLQGASISTQLSGIFESLKGIKGFRSQGIKKSLEEIKEVFSSFNNIDTSALEAGVSNIERTLNIMNSIHTGSGFTNFLRMTGQLEDAAIKLNNFYVSNSFIDSITRIVNAANTLNGVDFSGMRRMQDVFANMPDNVQVYFGAGTSVQDLAQAAQEISQIRETLSNAFPSDTGTGGTEIAEQLEETEIDLYDTADAVNSARISFGLFRTEIDPIAKGTLKAVSSGLKILASPLSVLGKQLSKAAEKAKQFLSSIKRIAMYRAVRAILKSITEGFAEGRKNLYYYSKEVGTEFAPSMDRAATAALYFKNSIGAATAPLTNAFIPVLERVVDHVVELLNRFNQLTAALTGASTWTRAVRYPTQWQDALDDAEESARRLKSTMLGFDELNVIEKAIGQGGRGNTSNLDYSRMFEEMPTENDFLNNIPEYLAPIRFAWDAEGDNTLTAIRNAWHEIADLVRSVGESFRTVWQNGTGQRTLETILQIVQNIVGTFGALAAGIRRAWDEGARGTRIVQGIWDVANNLLTIFRNIWGSIREWAENLNWSPLLSAIETVTDAFRRFTDPDGSPAQLLQYFFEHVLEPLATWTIEEGVPAALDLFSGAIDGLRVAIEFLQPGLEWCMDALSAIAGFTFSNISGLAEGFGAMMTIASGGEVSDEAVQRLENSNDRIRGFFQSITEFFGGEYTGGLNDSLQEFGANTLWDFFNPDGGELSRVGEGWYDWFHDEGQRIGYDFYDSINEGMEEGSQAMAATSLGDVGGGGFFSDFFDNWNDGMDDLVQSWQSGWQSISDFFTGIWNNINYAIDDFENAWDEGWNTITTGAQNAWQGLQDALANGWSRITGFVTGYTDAWTDGWRTIRTTVSNTWSNIKTSLSNGWNNLKNFVTDFKSHWTVGFNDIKNTVDDKWEQIKSSLSNGWEAIKGKVSEYATKWSSTLESIKRTVTVKFLEIKDAITNSAIWQGIERTVDRIRTAFSNAFGSIIGAAGTFIQSVRNIFENITNAVRSPIDRARSAMEGLVNGAVDMIAGVLQRLSELAGPARDAFERVTGISLDLSWNIPYFHLDGYANGGFPDSGQLFLARESGAEMVGSIGGHTAVANNDQIVQAVSAGVYNAVMSAMSNQNGSNNEFHVYLSGREISAEVNQVSRNNGASILGGVVYGT